MSGDVWAYRIWGLGLLLGGQQGMNTKMEAMACLRG